MLNPRRVLTRAQLLEHVWEYDFGGDARVLETYVSYLRKKLDAHGPPLIHTVRGVGYALRPPTDVMASLRAGSSSACSRSPPCGLLLLGGITYAEQRSFLFDRVDQQAQAAPDRSVAHELARRAAAVRSRSPAAARAAATTTARRRAAPTASCATPPATSSPRARSSATSDRHVQARPAREDRARQAVVTVGGDRHPLPRLRRAATPTPATIAVVAVPLREVDQNLHRLLLVEGLVIAGVLLALGLVAWVVVRVGLLPLDRMGHTAARSPAATCRTASSRPTRAPRSAAWASRSTRCSTGWSTRSPSARRARTACAGSSPTPRTSCARRWPRSAATPSCSAWAPPASRRTSSRRCGASRRRPRAWACSSRTC